MGSAPAGGTYTLCSHAGKLQLHGLDLYFDAQAQKEQALRVMIRTSGRQQAQRQQLALSGAMSLWCRAAIGKHAVRSLAELKASNVAEQKRLYAVVIEGWCNLSLQQCLMQWVRGADSASHDRTSQKLNSISSAAQMTMVTI